MRDFAGRLRLVLLATLAAVLAMLLGTGTASASALPAAETCVGVSTLASPEVVGVAEHIAAGQHWVRGPSQLRLVSGHCVAAEATADSGTGLLPRLGSVNWADDTGAISLGGRFTDDQDALIQLGKQAKQLGGLPQDEAEILAEWADELGLTGHGPALHPGRPGFGGTTVHINIGPIKHIPVLP
jgi:hypothetical protein